MALRCLAAFWSHRRAAGMSLRWSARCPRTVSAWSMPAMAAAWSCCSALSLLPCSFSISQR